jgi:catechol 2,3-dioxygenase-like lactoylglutathione lyase family enzyme
MEPRLSLITLGVRDVARSRAFYEALGFKAGAASKECVVFLDAGGIVLALWGRTSLAGDVGVADGTCEFSGVALAHNARSEAEVDAALNDAVAAGGTLVKAGAKAFWGGYSGYFADPDGHLWEVAHNPYFKLGDDGRIELYMGATNAGAA